MNRRWTARTEDDERIYAIGDVHGCHEKMMNLLALIEKDDATRKENSNKTIIFLGDLIDRGPDSAKVIEAVVSMTENYGNVMALRGNHEQVLLDIVRGEDSQIREWLRMGGRNTLRSYGIDPDWAAKNSWGLSSALKEKLPKRHLKWLTDLPYCARSGDYFFCHAGIKPKLSMRRQSNHDLMWIREEFLEYEGPHEAIVVHGHNIEEDVLMRSNRIGVDTGAYRTGKLSAIMLEGSERHPISTEA